MTRKALGRGLDALLNLDEVQNIDELKRKGEIVEIDINSIIPNQLQPRKIFNEEKLNELAESIKEKGIIQPIVVSKNDNNYEIIVGERRWRAAKIVNLEKIPVIIREISYVEKLELALIENIQREDLNPIELAETYNRLIDELKITQEELGKKIGKSRVAVTNTLRLLKLPEIIKNKVIDGKLKEGHGRALLGIKSQENDKLPEQIMEDFSNIIINEDLSVQNTEKMVSDYNKRTEMKSDIEEAIKKIEDEEEKIEEVKNNESDYLFKEFETELNSYFNKSVKIVSSKDGKGKIEIKYKSVDELKEIVSLIKNRS